MNRFMEQKQQLRKGYLNLRCRLSVRKLALCWMNITPNTVKKPEYQLFGEKEKVITYEERVTGQNALQRGRQEDGDHLVNVNRSRSLNIAEIQVSFCMKA